MSVDDDDDDVVLGACVIVNERGPDELPLEFVDNISEGEFDSLKAVVDTGTTTRAV